jgi:tetratricopeptide (TPR) repeat protein
LTPRERAYLRAVQVLYGEGGKPTRDQAYAEAMAAIHQEYPEDREAAAFYALALLGSVGPRDPAALRTRMRAAAIAQEVYREEPDHPGAAHYLLHAFDDPDHAILALPAARRYAEIAPAAFHARHMPSHIFLQLGMWPEAAASNEAAWKASEDWVKRKGLPISQRDYHSLHWLLYIYLQQGRAQEAKKLLETIRASLPQFPKSDPRMLLYGTYLQGMMAATFLVETEQWDAADAVLPQERSAAPPTGVPAPYRGFVVLAQAPAIFARGLSAAMKDSAGARESVAALRAIREQEIDTAGVQEIITDPMLQIQELEIQAAARAAGGNMDEAIAAMNKAIALADAMPPPPGPPPLIKPPHELFGEILLRANRPAEAVKQFQQSLFRHPNRRLSREGAARAAEQGGQPAEGKQLPSSTAPDGNFR